MSELQRSQNWDQGLHTSESRRCRRTQAQLYSGLPWAEDALGGAEF